MKTGPKNDELTDAATACAEPKTAQPVTRLLI
jgi:hypothetical protein